MSIMGINYSLTHQWNMAVTAMFGKYSLLFIKHMRVIINCWGVSCKSNLVPFLCYSHEMANEYFEHNVPAISHSIMRLNPQGRDKITLSLLKWGLDE